MSRDLKEICIIIEFKKVRNSKKNMIVIESIDSLLLDSIDIYLQTQGITQYFASNVILTILHEENSFYKYRILFETR